MTNDDFHTDSEEDLGVGQEECQSGTIGNQDETDWSCEPCLASEGHYQPIPLKGECEIVQSGYYVKIPEPASMCPHIATIHPIITSFEE